METTEPLDGLTLRMWGAGEFAYGENEHALVKELLDIQRNPARLNKLEAYNDSLERKEHAHHMFTLVLSTRPIFEPLKGRKTPERRQTEKKGRHCEKEQKTPRF